MAILTDYSVIPPFISKSPYLLGLILACTTLSGCQKVGEFVNRIRYPASAAASTPATDTIDTTNTTQPATAKPEAVSYPFNQWQKIPVKPLKVGDMASVNRFLTQQFGKSANLPSIDKKSLDFGSNLATQYRYTANTAPYFDVIDSPHYLELGWYYASPSDQTKEKKLAVDYAAHAYQLSRAWLGDPSGAKLIESMLAGDTVKNQTVGGVHVAMARCESFSCMLVLKKTKANS